MIKGIDVSSWQGVVDYRKVKAGGIDFVIIRAGFGREVSQKDNCFEQNYSAAKAPQGRKQNIFGMKIKMVGRLV